MGGVNMAKSRKEKGFILITMLFLLLLVALTAMSLNVKSGLQAKMTANQSADAQTYFSQLAVMEEATWELTKNPLWRTAEEPKTFQGEKFTLKIENSNVESYKDAISISVTAPATSKALKTSLRYYLSDLLYMQSSIHPERVCHDSANNLYIADADNHSIFKVDRYTYVLNRIAGNGNSGFSGDGGPATQAQLKGPKGVWVDSAGEIYIADSGNHRIRKVGTGGNITTVAGIGTAGYTGDNGLATSAKLNTPSGITGDSSSNIFIADTNNHRIRKVNTTGVITTVAGTGTAGYAGDDGLATSAQLNNPHGLYVNSIGSIIYVADSSNNRIRKVAIGGKITTVAGNGTASYAGDNGLATSASLNEPYDVYMKESTGEIIIADTNNHRIRRFLEDGNITTIAGTGVTGYSGDKGLATSAQINTPRGVTRKSTDELVIADTLNSCLREVEVATSVINTIVKAAPSLGAPRHIALDAAGNVYIADTNNHRILKMDPAGRLEKVAGTTGVAGYSGDNELATSAQLYNPASVAVDDAGNIYIADTSNCCIRKVDATTKIISRVAGKNPRDCDYSGNGVPATSAKLNYPYGVKVKAGNIYIADYSNNCIRKIDTAGIITTVAGICNPYFGSFSGDGGPATNARLNGPVDVFVDAANNIFIADLDNQCVRKVGADGVISTFAGRGTQTDDGIPATSAKLSAPRGLFVDTAGNLYIADRDQHVVRVVSGQDDSRKGYIYTLAGTGTAGYNWEGIPLPAVTAQLNSPASVAMAETRGGRLIYISDWKNNLIRMLKLKMEKKLY